MKKIISILVLIIFLALSISTTIYYFINPGFFQLKIDIARSIIIDLKKKKEGYGQYEIIIPESEKMMVSPYKNISNSFIQSGDFLFFKSRKDIPLKLLSEYVIKYTDYYKLKDLTNAIIKVNNLNKDIKIINKGTVLFIPDNLSCLVRDMKKTKRSKIGHIRGLYFTGYSVGQKNFFNKIKRYKKAGINAIVFDVKDIPGIISYKSNVDEVKKLNTHEKRSIENIEKLFRFLKEEDIYIIARIACFRDNLLLKKRPDLAIRSHSTGGVWNMGSGEIWIDPTNKEAQDYNIKLASEIAKLGADEIQFDYIRFPTVGNLNDAIFKYSFGKQQTVDTITSFLERATKEIHKENANVSIDIFGIVAWGYHVDIRKTGQMIKLLADHTDVISPMLYPSHFNNNFEGHPYPGDAPYYFISKGTEKVTAKSNNKPLVRPWLQAFAWRTSIYNANYIVEQIKATNDTSDAGYLFWNAKNSYSVVIQALERMGDSAKK